jgi:ribonuclease P protein component
MSTPLFTMYIKKNTLNNTRLGVSISKKVGKSTTRNKIKRRIKEIFRKNYSDIKKGYDVVISVKPGAAQSSFNSLNNEIIKTLKRGKILNV